MHVEEPSPQGLVSSPITRTFVPPVVPDTVPEGLAPSLKFPSAALLGLARDLFTPPAVHSDRVVGGQHSWREGPFPFLSFGPGIVRVQRVDVAKAERAEERRRAAARRDVDFAVALGELEATHRRARVLGWSSDSQARMLAKIASLDLEPVVSGTRTPAMATFTMPADWFVFAPTAAHAALLFDKWRRAYERKWAQQLRAIWKREFQRRGAPHWHLWFVPPTDDLAEFRAWMSESWNRVVFGSRIAEGPLRPGEQGKHLRAGTGLDLAEGMRARDPKRLSLYFLKESLGGEGKAYQNDPPAEWAGASVGRYWGVRGIPEALEVVALAPAEAIGVWRSLRKLRQSNAGVRTVRVPRTNQATGEVRYRRVRRRVKVRQSAGWVAVNDGANTAAAIARWIERSR